MDGYPEFSDASLYFRTPEPKPLDDDRALKGGKFRARLTFLLVTV